MQTRQWGWPKFQEQIVVLEERIAQAMFEQVWWQVTGDTQRRLDADLRLEALELQLAQRHQQRPPRA